MKSLSQASILALFIVCLISPFSSVYAEELFLLAGAGLRKPTDKIIQQFEKETGHTVLVEYGGSGKILARYRTTRNGDLFMPGSLFYINKLKKDNFVLNQKPVVYHTAVIGVHLKNGKNINSFQDLAKPGIKVALGDPKAMAFGRTSTEILKKSGLKEEIEKNTVVYGATVNQLTLYVLNRVVDASIIGRSNAFIHRQKIRMIPIPSAFFKPETVAIALLKSSKQPKIAKQFQEFVCSEKGIEQFKLAGFIPLEK